MTQLLSNRSCRPVHDFVMASEYVAQDLPKKFQGLVDPDGTPVYRCEEVKGLEGQYRIPQIEAKSPYCSTVNWKVAEDPVLHCLDGLPGHRENLPGAPDREEGYKVKDPLLRAELRHAGGDGRPLGAEHRPEGVLQHRLAGGERDHTAGHGAVERHRLRLHEPENQGPIARRLPPVPRHHAQIRGHPGAAGAQALPAAPRPHRRLAPRAHGEHEEHPGIFDFLTWLRVDEPREQSLAEALQTARERFPLPHARRIRINAGDNRRLAPQEAVTIEYTGTGPTTTNMPQTMRVWPGLKLIGAVHVTEVGPEKIVLDGGESFTHAALLKHTRLCHAITYYASCQGLTLEGRVFLCDTESPHFTLRHLYVGTSRATSSELLSVL